MSTVRSLVVCAGAALLTLFSAPAVAQENLLHIDVNAVFEPRAAAGLLLGPGGSREVAAEFEELPAGGYRVRFPVNPEKIEFGTAVTALVVGEDGRTAFGDVRSLALAQSRRELPECAQESAVRNNGLSIYQKLIRLREERRNLFKEGVEKEFTNELRDKLSTLERGFGLSTEPPLSADLEPLVLVDRLGRLKEALREYVASRGK